MAKQDKVYMPSGMGGLIRYGEEGKVKIKIKPIQLVYIVVGIVVMELFLKFFFA
jgi:preprotein translocase subunit Sec61beta